MLILSLEQLTFNSILIENNQKETISSLIQLRIIIGNHFYLPKIITSK